MATKSRFLFVQIIKKLHLFSNGKQNLFTLQLKSKWTFLKHLLVAIRIDTWRGTAKDVVSKAFSIWYWSGITNNCGRILFTYYQHIFTCHEYMPVWVPQIGDDLLFRGRELSNKWDEFAVTTGPSEGSR